MLVAPTFRYATNTVSGDRLFCLLTIISLLLVEVRAPLLHGPCGHPALLSAEAPGLGHDHKEGPRRHRLNRRQSDRDDPTRHAGADDRHFRPEVRAVGQELRAVQHAPFHLQRGFAITEGGCPLPRDESPPGPEADVSGIGGTQRCHLACPPENANEISEGNALPIRARVSTENFFPG